MSTKFEPVRITDLVAEKTEQSPTASGLRLMYLRLSTSPTTEWIQLFDNQRFFPKQRNIVSGSREAKVRGNYIVVDCVPEEMERHHTELKHDVAVTNNEYQEYLNRVAAKIVQEDQVQKAEQERIAGIKSRLKFD
jgi:hypothetical protein